MLGVLFYTQKNVNYFVQLFTFEIFFLYLLHLLNKIF